MQKGSRKISHGKKSKIVKEKSQRKKATKEEKEAKKLFTVTQF
jgi:hypothetical protein